MDLTFDSSNLNKGTYDSKTQELEIEFHSGATYVYENVPKSEVMGLLSATSQGKFFNKYIDKKYEKRKR